MQLYCYIILYSGVNILLFTYITPTGYSKKMSKKKLS